MHCFQINVLILFLTSSTCFELHGFNNRKTVCPSSFCMVCFSYICVSSLADGRVCSMPATHGAKNIKYSNKLQKIWELFGILKVLAGVDVFVAVCMCEVNICITFKSIPVPTWCMNRGQGRRWFILMEEIRILMQVSVTLHVFLYPPLAFI
jgi:hypothetical protein